MAAAYTTSCAWCACWHLFVTDARCGFPSLASLRVLPFSEEGTEDKGQSDLPMASVWGGGGTQTRAILL